MSQFLRSLRLLLAVAAVLASGACMSNPFGPADAGDAVVPTGTIPLPDYCLEPANVNSPLCPFHH
jgi:hypothetical protein